MWFLTWALARGSMSSLSEPSSTCEHRRTTPARSLPVEMPADAVVCLDCGDAVHVQPGLFMEAPVHPRHPNHGSSSENRGTQGF